MDPNAAHKQAVEAMHEIQTEFGNADGPDRDRVFDAAENLADSFEALDDWISGGGFFPKAWDLHAKDAGLSAAVHLVTGAHDALFKRPCPRAKETGKRCLDEFKVLRHSLTALAIVNKMCNECGGYWLLGQVLVRLKNAVADEKEGT